MKAEPVRALLFVPEERRAVMRILYLKTDIFDNEYLWNKAFSMISEDRREKIRNYKNEMTARLSLGAGVLLRIVMDKNGVSEEQIVTEEYGKPYLSGGAFHFNLSHSGDMVVCAISEKQIGVDIEQIEDIKENIARRFFTKYENQYLNQYKEERKRNEFFRLWTMKESYMKYTGEGMKLALDKFEFHFDNETSVYRDGKKVVCYIKEYDVPGYRLTVCADEDGFETDLIEVVL
jgi:4'-phosphopantetheinyl transferase